MAANLEWEKLNSFALYAVFSDSIDCSKIRAHAVLVVLGINRKFEFV